VRSQWFKISIATVATCALLAQGGVQILPLNADIAYAETSISNQTVKLTNSATLSIRDGQFLMQEQGKVFAYTLSITNNGSADINMRDYYVRLKSKSGKKYSSVVIEADKTRGRIAPRTTQTITYYAVVDNTAKIADLTFDIIKWDFSVSGYERKLGTISYPAGSTDKVKAYSAKSMLINNTNIRGLLKQYTVTKDNSNLFVTMNVLLENKGYKSVDLATNMKFFAQTDSLAVYNVSTTALTDTIIQPNESQIVTLNVTMPLTMAGKAFSLIAASTNETTKTEVPAGVFAMPIANPAVATANGQKKSIYINGESVHTTIGLTSSSNNEDSKSVELDFTFENSGVSTINAPELSFSILTTSGVSYPMSYTKEQMGTSLLPKIKKVITLTGELPAGVNPDTTKLLVRAGVTDKDKGYVLGSYQMKLINTSGSVGGSYLYNSSYDIKLNAIQRLPMGENDIITADLNIVNNSTISKKSPKLSGYFVINGVKLDAEHQVVSLDTAVNISPKGVYNTVVYAPVPYSTEINSISFVLTETAATATEVAKKLFQFGGQNISKISNKPKNQAYQITNAGRMADISVLKTNFYDDDKTSYFYSEFEITNKELRSTVLANLGGYIQDSDGLVAPLQFVELKEKIMPNGKVLMTAWTKVSKYFDKKNFDLIIGQSITNSKVSNPADGETVDPQRVIIKPVSYTLKNSDASVVKNSLKDIQFAGYKVALDQLHAYINVSSGFTVNGIRLNLTYDLVKDAKYDYIAGDHKILVEFVDQSAMKATYSKLFSLKAGEANTTLLKEGMNQSLTIDFDDPEVQLKVQNYDKYIVNIYDVFQDAKMLVATKQLRWFYAD